MKEEVLNKGFILLVDVMGSDNRVVNAARISTGAIEIQKEKDVKLINYLMKNKHETPFEKIVFEFHVKCPIFIARQIFRHRIGSFNEFSGRYREFEFEAFTPDKWRKQNKTNHQSSSTESFEEHEEMLFDAMLESFYRNSNELYKIFLSKGVSRELARIVLPLGIYTEFFWTVNFRSLMNFLTLRNHKHAQKEIRDYAIAIEKIIDDIPQMSMSWQAFKTFYKK